MKTYIGCGGRLYYHRRHLVCAIQDFVATSDLSAINWILRATRLHEFGLLAPTVGTIPHVVNRGTIVYIYIYTLQ